eukprot:12048052-Heterocapsa_arctica.AAC.1
MESSRMRRATSARGPATWRPTAGGRLGCPSCGAAATGRTLASRWGRASRGPSRISSPSAPPTP